MAGAICAMLHVVAISIWSNLHSYYGADIDDIHNVEAPINNNHISQLITSTERANESVKNRLKNNETLEKIIKNGVQPTVIFEHVNLDQKETLLQIYPYIFYSYLYHRKKLNKTIAKHQNIPKQWALYAAVYGNRDIMHTLKDLHKNRMHTKDQWGNTLMHIAALYNNQSDIIRELLPQQMIKPISNINPKPGPYAYNNAGVTPYDIAKKQGNKNIGRMLFTYAKMLRLISGKQSQYAQDDDQEETQRRPGKRNRSQYEEVAFPDSKRARTAYLPTAQQNETHKTTMSNFPKELRHIIAQNAINKK